MFVWLQYDLSPVNPDPPLVRQGVCIPFFPAAQINWDTSLFLFFLRNFSGPIPNPASARSRVRFFSPAGNKMSILTCLFNTPASLAWSQISALLFHSETHPPLDKVEARLLEQFVWVFLC